MSRRARKVLVVVCAVVGLFAIALLATVWLLLDEQQLRAQASRYVKQHTGRDLGLHGPISLSFFPWLGAELNDVTVGQPGAAAGAAPFARFDEVTLRVRVIPLIQRVIEVGGVRGSGGVVSLPGYTLRDLAVTTGAFGGRETTDLSLKFNLVPTGKGAVPVELDSRMLFDLAAQRLDLNDLKGHVGGMAFTGTLQGQRVMEAPAFNGRIETESFDLRALMAQLGVAYTPVGTKAMSAAKFSGQLSRTTDRLELRDVVLSLDGSTWKGRAVGTTLPGRQAAAWDAQLSIDSLDVDRYMPAATAPAASAGTSDPYASLRALVARARLDVGTLRAFGLQMTGVNARVEAGNGTITVAPVRAALYGGQGELAARMSVTGRVPTYHVEGKLAGIDVQPFLKDAQDIDALSGTGDLTLRVDAASADPTRLTQAAGGDVSLSVRDGRIEGADFLKLLTQARTISDQLRGRPVSAQADPADRTKFTRLWGTGVLEHGVLRNSDLRLDAPDLRATGVGAIDLTRERIDFQLRATSDQAGNVMVPISIAGPFDAPGFRVEAGAMLKDAATQRLKKELEKRGLKGLFRKP